jgi:hypothetical protein
LCPRADGGTGGSAPADAALWVDVETPLRQFQRLPAAGAGGGGDGGDGDGGGGGDGGSGDEGGGGGGGTARGAACNAELWDDGIHLTPEGYDRLAGVVAEVRIRNKDTEYG